MEQKNLFLITGNDELVIHAKAKALFERLAGEDPDPFAVDIYPEPEEGPSADVIIQAVRSLQSPPFLGHTKIVWLKHISCLDQEGSDKPNGIGKALRELGQLLKQGLPEDIAFLMDGSGLDKRKILYKTFVAKGEITVCNKPDMSQRNWEEEFRNYLSNAMSEKGMRFAPDAFSYLMELLGTDTARTGQELEKIICYRGTTEGVVSLEDVQAVCVGKGEEMSWALNDTLGQRNLQEALRVIDVLISQNKGDEGYARAMFLAAAGFFRTGIRIKVLQAKRRLNSPESLKRAVQNMSDEEKSELSEQGMDFIEFHPYRIQVLAAAAAKYTPAEMIRAIRLLQDGLWQITSSATSPRIALENTLTQIISKA